MEVKKRRLFSSVKLLLILMLSSASLNLGMLVSQAESLVGINQPYSQDSQSLNHVDGYLSYTGWYRPKKIKYGGTEWQDNQNDWRPYLMYTWPNEDVMADYLIYFLQNGFQSTNNQLTVAKVNEAKKLSPKAKTITLNNYASIMRDNIESVIQAGKMQTMTDTMNAFVKQNAYLSSKSEQSLQNSTKSKYVPSNSGTLDADQIAFKSSALTPNTSSKFRLLNRTTVNQRNQFDPANTAGVAPELLVGNDIDNSNPIVQAENLNWEYFLLNYGTITAGNDQANFDGFRVDAADCVDVDILDQLGQLTESLYKIKGNPQAENDHLVYNEGYEASAQKMLNKAGNCQLFMDANYFYHLENALGYKEYLRTGKDEPRLHNLPSSSVVDRTVQYKENTATPNWSFVNNHDQQKNRINQIMIDQHPDDSTILADGYTKEKEASAINYFKNTKNYRQPMNLPAQYALLLTNKDTVPQVYYGDMYDEFAPYMSSKTENYQAIETLLKARKKYVAGDQSMTVAGNGSFLTSVREGKDRNTGIAVVLTNGNYGKSHSETISLGQLHKNQEYVQVLGNEGSRLVYNENKVVTTDANGKAVFPVNETPSIGDVNGKPENPNMVGHLGVWVPKDVVADQDARTAPSEVQVPNDGKTYHSNAALDSHVIFEAHSLYIPDDGQMYQTLANRVGELVDMGISDIWMPPAYKNFNPSRYNEGYSLRDRYDLGETEATKYGTATDLRNVLVKIHEKGLKAQLDLVLNQMFGYNQQEAVMSYRADNYGRNYDQSPTLQKYLTEAIKGDFIYFAYTKGGGEKQKEYGGAFLADLQAKYPTLFTTKAASTGVAPDPSVKIKEWKAAYQNATSTQNLGINLAMKIGKDDYAYLKADGNTIKDTVLPEELRADYDAQVKTGKQIIDGQTYQYDEQGILQNMRPLYRIYNPNSGEHFYTLDIGERDGLKNHGWNDEGIIGYMLNTEDHVYRLYNPNAGDHHYTRSAAERDWLKTVGWKDEGVAFDSGGPVNILRLYNPNAATGTHHYTQHQSERDSLVKIGWRFEGTGWFSH